MRMAYFIGGPMDLTKKVIPRDMDTYKFAVAQSLPPMVAVNPEVKPCEVDLRHHEYVLTAIVPCDGYYGRAFIFTYRGEIG